MRRSDLAGHFLDSVELFGGMRVFDANPKVEEAVAGARPAVASGVVPTSVPHCWRCHNPVIFLATSQWLHPNGRRAGHRSAAGCGLRARQPLRSGDGRCGRRRSSMSITG